MKIMLVEDTYLLNKAIKTYLLSKNFKVDSYIDGLEALGAISLGYDLFIVDIDIPSLTGVELLEEIRMLFPSTPVIMISATIDMDMITKAYTLGCSDYLKKPFDIKELELKIRAFTRELEEKVYLSDALVYNKTTKQLHRNTKEVKLTPYEQKILHLLLENRSRLVLNETIESTVWGADSQVSYLRQTMSRLRKKLQEDIIKNYTAQGYSIL